MKIALKEEGCADVIKSLQKITGKSGNRAQQSALKSCGWYLQQALKDEGRRGSRIKWGRLNPHTHILAARRPTEDEGSRRPIPRYKRGRYKGKPKSKKSRKLKPMSRMVNAPRYTVAGNTSESGFVAQADRFAGTISSMAVPAAIKVTPKMRRYFFAVGFPLKKETKWLYRRARRWVQPRYEQEKNRIGKRYEEKFIGALERYGVKFESHA